MLATVQEAKDVLRYDGNDQDPILELALKSATSHILGYLGVPEEVFDDGGLLADPDFHVPYRVRMACIVYAGILLRDPTGVQSEEYEHGYMPRVVMNLLYQYRRVAVAASTTSDYPEREEWWLRNVP